MARHNNFYSFRPAKARGPKEEERSSRQNRLQRLPAEIPTTYNGRSTVGSSLIGPISNIAAMYYHPPLDRSMSLLNQHSYSHVIRIYQPSFCRAGRQDKITLWCQQEKSSHEHLNKFPVNRRLCLTRIHLAAHNRFYLFSPASPQ